MKFSIVIPTQNRPELMALAVRYALTQNYGNIEVIVSDNSTNDDFREKNRRAVEGYVKNNRLLLVNTPKVLSLPEHFEFALQYATGDYVLYLTDKMMLLPDTLARTEYVIRATGAEIINWTDISVNIDDFQRTTSASDIWEDLSPTSNMVFHKYDPISELKDKASGFIPRTHQSKESYVSGKICFGCFGRDLIERIRKYSGGFFGGLTHDYSAMIQGLCLSRGCAMLDLPGIVFISLPLNKSTGSLTHLQSAGALSYYKSFSNPDTRLASLFIPHLYASLHNMVASDYVKYLALYNKSHFFIEKYWLRSIGLDLRLKDRIWTSEEERKSQINRFFRFLIRKPNTLLYWYYYLLSLRMRPIKARLVASVAAFRVSVLFPFYQNLVDALPSPVSSVFESMARKVFRK